MAIGSIILGALGLIFVVFMGGTGWLLAVGIIIAAAGALAGGKQSQADQEEGRSPAMSYLGVALSVIALIIGALRGVIGSCFG